MDDRFFEDRDVGSEWESPEDREEEAFFYEVEGEELALEGPELSETRDDYEWAGELLELSSEEEIDQFLDRFSWGSLWSGVKKGLKTIAPIAKTVGLGLLKSTPIGAALSGGMGNMLKGLLNMGISRLGPAVGGALRQPLGAALGALPPALGRAVRGAIGPAIGAATDALPSPIGSALTSLASQALGVEEEPEGLDEQDLAAGVIRFMRESIQDVASEAEGFVGDPEGECGRIMRKNARKHAPYLLRRTSAPRGPTRRPARRRPGRRGSWTRSGSKITIDLG